jgi:hypothetical protein
MRTDDAPNLFEIFEQVMVDHVESQTKEGAQKSTPKTKPQKTNRAALNSV